MLHMVFLAIEIPFLYTFRRKYSIFGHQNSFSTYLDFHLKCGLPDLIMLASNNLCLTCIILVFPFVVSCTFLFQNFVF